MIEIKNKEDKTEKNLENQRCEEKHVNPQDKVFKDLEKISENEIIEDKTMNSEILQVEKIQNNCESTTNSHENIKDNCSKDSSLFSNLMLLEKSPKRQTKIILIYMSLSK